MANPRRPCAPRLAQVFTSLHAIVITALLLQTLAVMPGHAQEWCGLETANYTATSQFKRNLDLLLANLSDVPATAARGHFRSASVGGPEDVAYGLAQCDGDVFPTDCAACLKLRASDVVSRCQLRRVAAIHEDGCLLRYSDKPFLGNIDNGDKRIFYNVQNTTDPEVFDQRLMEMVTKITSEAAEKSSRFAVAMAKYPKFQDMYGLAQCTRDLSQGSCDQCLRDLIGNLQRGKVGGVVSAVSCILRFETYPFFSFSVIPPPPSPSPLQASPGPPPESSSATPPPAGGEGSSTGGRSRNEGKKSNISKILVIVIIPVVSISLFLFGMIICLKRRRLIQTTPNGAHEQSIKSSESLLFDIATLKIATRNFSDANKLGEGGFGPVYKGVLQDGQQIAVKRFSGMSGQGLRELRNEVLLVAKLQHRNLVKLLGFCLEEDEKMVVYEYLPNTSLDKFLFDPIKRLLLDWGQRYKLIEGIARGLVYLHEDSRLRIIHHDLKASNILLDEHLNPKISDFGLARLFGVDETHGNTSRIAGTFGYMAPEYAMHGQFSTKLDVYSFGVLALEIVTGRKNGDLNESGNAIDLPSYAWCHWNEGTALQLLDQSVERYERHEVLRCIYIGLLCVQEDSSKRLNMSAVALMLTSGSVTLPTLSRPAFFIGGSETSNVDGHLSEDGGTCSENESSSQNMGHPRIQSANEVTISDLEPR